MKLLPAYFTVLEVARMIGWDKQRTLRWLQKSEAAIFRAGRWVTTPALLRANFPEAWDRYVPEEEDE